MLVFRALAQDCAGKCRLIGGIRKILCFQTKGVAGAIGAFSFSLPALGQKVCGVELYTGLCGMYLHGNARFFAAGCGGGTQRVCGAVDDIVMVIAMAQKQLGENIVNVCADGSGFSKIHRSSVHGRDNTNGDIFRIVRCVMLCKKLDCLVQNGAAVVTGEVEVAVVCQVAEGVCVGNGAIVDCQGCVIDRIGDIDLKSSGISFLSVRTCEGKGDRVGRTANHIPNAVGESCESAVKVVCAVVCRQGIFFAVEREPGTADSICKSADSGAKITVVVHVFTKRVIAQNNVDGISAAVGDKQGLQCGTVSEDFTGDFTVIQ